MNFSATRRLSHRMVHTINIEIGDRVTKVCYSVPKGKSFQIKTSFLFQTPDGAVSDGSLLAPEVLAEALLAQLKEHGLHGVKHVAFAISSTKIATREVTLPPVKEARIQALVQANATDYFPIDMSKYHVAATLLELVTEGDNPGCLVAVYAAPLALLDGFAKLAELCKLEVLSIDYSGNSQYQALKSMANPVVTLYVNVDCAGTMVSFIQGDKLLLQRSVGFGGDELITRYLSAAEQAQMPYLDALSACSVPLADFLAAAPLTQQEVQDSHHHLTVGLSRAMDFFNTNHWDQPVEQVVLMGPCGRLAGLREAIAESTDLETLHMNEMAHIAAFANAAESASCFISCIGSSLSPLDLIPESVKQSNKRARQSKNPDSTRVCTAFCVACAVLTVALSALAFLGYLAAGREKAALEQEIASLAPVQETFDLYTQYQAGVASFTALSDMIDSPNAQLSAFFAELEQKMPRQLRVLSMVCTPESVDMNITVPSFEVAAAVVVQLRSFASLDSVAASDMTETLDEAGFSSVSFSVSCLYPPKVLPELPPADAAQTDPEAPLPAME